jgi:hypothetical protein
MRTKEEIDTRINQISGFLELSKEMGQSNPNQRNKLKKEIMVLDWVLGNDNLEIKNRISNESHVQDSIIVFLRDQTEEVSISEIEYHTGKNPGSISSALRALTAADRLYRTGEPKKYFYSIKTHDALNVEVKG